MSVPGGFSVERTERVVVTGPQLLVSSELMSPYVWMEPDGCYGMLVRVVPQGDGASTGLIWYARSNDGLDFRADAEPLIAPDADGPDRMGCEDPTVVHADGRTIVFYTGVSGPDSNELLWAEGATVHSLVKRGTAFPERRGERQIKEAEINFQGGRWLIAYEYAEDGASGIDFAQGAGPAGPWRGYGERLRTREGCWDGWHLSPGPLLLSNPNKPVMFYNGATPDAVWSIGWIAFDARRSEITGRCDEPLITPPGEERGRNMAFAASLIEESDRLLLYYTENDRAVRRAIINRV